MKTKLYIFSALFVALSGASLSAQADDSAAAIQGFMGIVKMMQQQSGAKDDPTSKAMMDALGKELDKNDDGRDRSDRGNRSGQSSGGKGKQQQAQDSDDDEGRGERRGGQSRADRGERSERADRDGRQRDGASAKAEGNRRHRSRDDE